ncbi:MAG: phosphotransferase [Betaproteobacteria bacterium]
MSHATPSPGAVPGAPFLPSPHAVSWTDPARELAFNSWLNRVASEHGLASHSIRTACADASFRRYLRVDVRADSHTFGSDVLPSRVIMDAPPEQEDCAPFVHVAAVMAQAGLNVPQVLDWDRSQGFMLLSDLGPQTMMDAIRLRDDGTTHALFLKAVDTLLAWQLASRAGLLPVYDEALLRRELTLFPDWYVQQHRSVVLDSKMLATLQNVFSAIVADNLHAPSVFVHHDFMPRNLMLAPAGFADSRLGILDFQDATYA